MTKQAEQADQNTQPSRGWRSRLRHARRPLRRLAILLILALIVEYLVIPELVGASKDLYLLGRLNVWWMIAGLILAALVGVCSAQYIKDRLTGVPAPLRTAISISRSRAKRTHAAMS